MSNRLIVQNELKLNICNSAIDHHPYHRKHKYDILISGCVYFCREREGHRGQVDSGGQ